MERDLLEKVIDLRIRIDAAMDAAEYFKYSSETTLAWRSLQMGKSWLGKIVGALKNTPGYEVVNDPSKIPPPKDVKKYKEGEPGLLFQSKNKLDSLNILRREIQDIIDSYPDISNVFNLNLLPFDYSIKHLSEARFWYGFALGELRKEYNSGTDPENLK